MDTDPNKTLLTLRFLWAMLLAGQLMFMVVVALVLSGPGSSAPYELFVVACMAAPAAIVAAHVVRMQIYKKHWISDAVTPRGYFVGNLIYLAMLEGASFFGLVVMLIGGRFLPYVIPSLVLMAVQVVNYPHGRPMRPPVFSP